MGFFGECVHGRLRNDCLICATKDAGDSVAAAVAAATDARRQDAQSVARQAQTEARHARRVAQHEQDQVERAQRWRDLVAAVDAGQSEDLEDGTLSRPDADAMLPMVQRRYGHLSAFPIAAAMLTRWAEHAQDGEEAVGVAGGVTFLDGRASEGIVIVSTHGVTWCFALTGDPVANTLWIPYETMTEYGQARAPHGYDGYAFQAAAGDRKAAVILSGDDQVGVTALQHALDLFLLKSTKHAKSITIVNDLHAQLLTRCRHRQAGGLLDNADNVRKYAELVHGRTVIKAHSEFDKWYLRLFAVTDTHAISSDTKGNLSVFALAEVTHKGMRDPNYGFPVPPCFDMPLRVPSPWETGRRFFYPDGHKGAFAVALETGVRKAQPAKERRGLFRRG